jgi:hypothetical protein
VRYPGAKLARADDSRCDIHADIIAAGNWSRLEIDF